MKFEFFVAARYLRAKRRQAVISVITLISIVGVTAGVASLVIALAINAGFREDLQNQLLGSQSHINLEKVKNDGIYNWPELMSRLEKQPHVTGAAPTLYEYVLATRGSRAGAALLKGVIPQYENRVSELLKTVKIGSAQALNPLPPRPPCDPKDESCSTLPPIPPVVLGKDLAESIGATVGSVVTMISPQGELTPFGTVPKYERFQVVGIFRSGFYNYDNMWAFIRLQDAQRLYALGDVVSAIEFKIDDLYKANQVADELQKVAGPEYMAKSWMEQNQALFRALSLERLVTFLTIGLIVFVAALNILIALIMMVMEKTKDIAVLMSMGARRRQVRGIFIFQGVLIGVIGTILGLIVGYGVAIAGAKYHFIALNPEVYSINYVPFAPRLLDGVLVAAVALVISFVATLYPSWSAARVLPAEALRYE
ncbi:MAG TPA: FtsX-like permease family protein [Candidatus Angelobacter sp.]|nr:FtsX-like permease family protein [Candidatus Angelobacter sp.]